MIYLDIKKWGHIEVIITAALPGITPNASVGSAESTCEYV
jgi:hypothetical protein